MNFSGKILNFFKKPDIEFVENRDFITTKELEILLNGGMPQLAFEFLLEPPEGRTVDETREILKLIDIGTYAYVMNPKYVIPYQHNNKPTKEYLEALKSEINQIETLQEIQEVVQEVLEEPVRKPRKPRKPRKKKEKQSD